MPPPPLDVAAHDFFDIYHTETRISLYLSDARTHLFASLAV